MKALTTKKKGPNETDNSQLLLWPVAEQWIGGVLRC